MVQTSRLVMPKLGLTMTEGTVSEWPIAEGARFERGQIYLIVETDKVANEIEAPAAGRFTRILVPQGETVEVGTLLAEWESEDGEAAARAPAQEPPPAPAAASARGPAKASSSELVAARRMTEAKQQIPHFYLATEIEVTRLQAARAAWNAREQGRATLTHLFVAGIARALARHPECNRIWSGEGYIELERVDVGIAVDTRHGLLVPMLRDAAGMDLRAIVRTATELIERARSATLTAADMGGGAVTVSNAGMHDVTYMTSIINPGQSAILGVGSERQLFRPDDLGAPKLVREIGVVLSCDHRVLDGVRGLALLRTMRELLQAPEALFG